MGFSFGFCLTGNTRRSVVNVVVLSKILYLRRYGGS